ncbi:sensor histidine kinase [Croceibacterium aestuarii]|uniref:sensor histidine kinase n=1 Tax=Croceibacterium aestuarii TaxID=3064139 RepID=UPI00272E897B|nr:ATP-binding protein [Croceibacterium sp. D39]
MNLFFWLEVFAAVVLVGMLASSWLALRRSGETSDPLPSLQAAALLVGTLIPALALVVLWGRRMAIRRAGDSSARLHVKLVFFFSLVAAVPTLLVAVFASILFQSGVEFWFSSSNRGILEDASRLARGYYDENQRSLANNTTTMAGDLRYVIERIPLTSPDFSEQWVGQILQRELSRSAIVQVGRDGEMVIPAIVDPDDGELVKRAVRNALPALRAGEGVVVALGQDRVEAVTPIDRDAGIYLYNARNSDALARNQWERAQSVLAAYDQLTGQARSRQLQFNVALFAFSLALVLLAVWFALRFADRQVRPLTDLVAAARQVGGGNYALRVEGRTGPDEIGLLNRAFNRMTGQIEQQTAALVGANKQLAERRAFIETVLQSITAGIVSVDRAGEVQLINTSAQQLLLGRTGPSAVGRKLEDISPEIDALMRSGSDHGLVQKSHEGELLTLAVRLAPAANGWVITFEDITRQLIDQRQAAWSDVARRIAHEIKNPLTPIQLATERLNRRYRKQIEQDVELFDELTGTIIRQVGDLRKMVDEFSSFARLPKPVFRQEDAVDLVRQAMFLQEVARPEIDYRFSAPEHMPLLACDRHQFGQVMTNVLKNAAEAIEARRKDSEPDYRGRIGVEVGLSDRFFSVTVTDNGVGLPSHGSDRILEPYVTTREKGTGLGLAIVKKIIEEHAGDMTFASNGDGEGTTVTLRFARDPVANGKAEAAE